MDDKRWYDNHSDEDPEPTWLACGETGVVWAIIIGFCLLFGVGILWLFSR